MMKRSISVIALTLAGLALGGVIAVPTMRHLYGVDVAEVVTANVATIFGMVFVLVAVALATYGLVRLFGWIGAKSDVNLKRLPVVTVALTIVISLNPVGLAFLHDALFATEQLTRNIAGPIVLSALSALTGLAVAEIFIRGRLKRN